jgi:hypothetical protein
MYLIPSAKVGEKISNDETIGNKKTNNFILTFLLFKNFFVYCKDNLNY